MVTVELEKQCACFKRSGIEAVKSFETLQEAKNEAKSMCEHMNEEFCFKHYFESVIDGEKIIIKMSLREEQMIDLKLLQKDFEKIALALVKKGVDDKMLDELRVLATNAKEKRQDMEALQAEQNSLSAQFGQYKKEGKDVNELTIKLGDLKKTKANYEEEVRVLEEQMTNIALGIPNLPDD